MLKELFATVLLLHGCSSNSLNHLYADSNECDDSNIVERLETPYYAFNDQHISGIYNYQHQVDLTGVNIDDSFTLVFEDISNNGYWYQVPIYIDGNMYYLYELEFETIPEDVEIMIHYKVYNEVAWTGTYTDYIFDDYTEDDMSYSAVYFDVRCDIGMLDSYEYNLFNLVYTHEDNDYVTTYSGYYSFVNNLSSIGQSVGVLGYVTANTSIYLGFSNSFNGLSTTSLKFMYYNLETKHYYQDSFALPFDVSNYNFNNMLFTECKMSNDVKSRLQNVGTFAYVRNSQYENTDFKGLLFGVMDSALYMITSLLNFDFLGVNLFVAFAGLLTLAIVLILIRKVW